MKQLISIFFSTLKEGVRWNVCLKGCVISIISINSYIYSACPVESLYYSTGVSINLFEKQILDFDDIRIDFKQEDIILQGEKTIIKYKITNTSNAFLVFGAGMSKYGGISKKDNKFYHNTMQQQHTPPVFFNFPEFIPPNSTTEKSFEIKPFKSGKIRHIDTLHYFKIDETNVNKIFIFESKDGMALPGAPGTIVYRNIKDLNELKNMQTEAFAEILIPQIYQQELKRTIRYEFEIDIEESQIFQELYSKFKPKDIIELKEIANLALNTDNGTILVKEKKTLNIGNVELSALKTIDEIKDSVIFIWVEPEKGIIMPFLEKYGKKNIDDQMYHGNFSYSMKLPKTELLSFFKCMKLGRYRMTKGSGMFYEGEIRVLY